MENTNEFIKSLDDFSGLERLIQEKRKKDISIDLVRIDMLVDSLCERVSTLESENELLRFQIEKLKNETNY